MKKPATINEFESSLKTDLPPSSWSAELQALWWDAKGDWSRAHALVDSPFTPEATWIHAYLHRKEGDIWNADYWYRRAGINRPLKSLEEEFRDILESILPSAPPEK